MSNDHAASKMSAFLTGSERLLRICVSSLHHFGNSAYSARRTRKVGRKRRQRRPAARQKLVNLLNSTRSNLLHLYVRKQQLSRIKRGLRKSSKRLRATTNRFRNLFAAPVHPTSDNSLALSRLQKHSSLAKPRQRMPPKGEVL